MVPSYCFGSFISLYYFFFPKSLFQLCLAFDFLNSIFLPASGSVLTPLDLMSNCAFPAFHLWHSFKNGLCLSSGSCYFWLLKTFDSTQPSFDPRTFPWLQPVSVASVLGLTPPDVGMGKRKDKQGNRKNWLESTEYPLFCPQPYTLSTSIIE